MKRCTNIGTPISRPQQFIYKDGQRVAMRMFNGCHEMAPVKLDETKPKTKKD